MYPGLSTEGLRVVKTTKLVVLGIGAYIVIYGGLAFVKWLIIMADTMWWPHSG